MVFYVMKFVLKISLYVYLKEWHPDNMKDPKDAREAEGRFQQIQEAYSGIFVLKKHTCTYNIILFLLFHLILDRNIVGEFDS